MNNIRISISSASKALAKVQIETEGRIREASAQEDAREGRLMR
jgi:hypothetical protein